MKLVYVVFLSLFTASTSIAEVNSDTLNSKISANLKVDIVSRHVWRGIINNSSPSAQPTMEFKLWNFNIGAWASYSLAKENMQEIDLFVGYNYRNFAVYIYDYYNPIDTLGWKGDFFYLKNSSTRHTLENIITYSGTGNLPIQLLAAVMFYGFDKNVSGNNVYSTYFEAGYKFKLNQLDITPHIGFTPWKGYYASNADIVNMGLTISKEIKVNDNVRVPIRSSFIVNPNQNKAYVILGITI